MDVKIHSSWNKLLNEDFNQSYFGELTSFVKSEYQIHTVYPPGDLIFNAMDHCHVDDVKVVIIGQDPYHGDGQANGLSFSVNDGIKVPPSLRNIFKELNSDLDIPIAKNGNLERWADQGVLLLNATLTVRANEAGSHQKHGWETFTDSIIKKISENKENLVFMLWGKFAQNKETIIDTGKHLILKSPHPSPFSAYSGFFGNKHFSKANIYLKSKSLIPIEW